MLNIALNDFRGFHKQKFVELRPMTVLVGENSAGKSSFLAAVKYIYDFVSGEMAPSFNKDPFQLGTFQQIAHNRGGGVGRARTFSLRFQLRTVNRDLVDVPVKKPDYLTFELSFVTSESQAIVSTVTLSSKVGTLKTYLSPDNAKSEFTMSNGDNYQLSGQHLIFLNLGSGSAQYWSLFLRQLGKEYTEIIENKRGTEISENRLKIIRAFCKQAANSLASVSTQVEASSAIRTKPLRTYTPGLESQDSEGSHVPMELAKLYRARNKESWNKIKNLIEDFGSSSEMFKEISVKSFGKSASDPFQIQFASDGPKTNIVDLGYGTSQVIPILYSIAISPMESTFLIQQPEVHLHARAQSALGQFFIKGLRDENKSFVLETHSDFIVDRIRKAVADKILSPKEVSILFFERKRLENTITQINLGEDGEPIKPPSSYRSFFIGEQLHMLGL